MSTMMYAKFSYSRAIIIAVWALHKKILGTAYLQRKFAAADISSSLIGQTELVCVLKQF